MSDRDPELHSLMAELLLAEPHELDAARFEQSVRRLLPKSRLLDSTGKATMIAHEDFHHEYADGKVAPMLTAVLTPDSAETSDIDVSQSWRFPDAESVVRSATERRLVVQIMGIAHTPQDRVRSFHAALCAAIEQLQPVAVWSPHSQQFIDPAEVMDNHLAAVVNVRLFNVESDPGVRIMDTIGLHVLQLPDVQCHFRDLDPSGVATLLYNAANYLFDEGDVIKDGNTIAGVGGTGRWRCRHELAMVGPERIVLDVDPGEPYAAGQRDRTAPRARFWSRRDR